MTMTPRLRKFALTAHITFSVGWLGAVGAYPALAIAGLTSKDAQMVRTAYLAMEFVGCFVIVPCSLTAVLTGLIQALATQWGLFRHYWVLVKFLLTIPATIILRVASVSMGGSEKELDGMGLAGGKEQRSARSDAKNEGVGEAAQLVLV